LILPAKFWIICESGERERFWEQAMSQQVNEDDSSLADLRRRNLRAAALLKQWMIEDADDDQSYWPFLEQELRNSALQCQDPEEA
jgi:hypothetical protein